MSGMVYLHIVNVLVLITIILQSLNDINMSCDFVSRPCFKQRSFSPSIEISDSNEILFSKNALAYRLTTYMT